MDKPCNGVTVSKLAQIYLLAFLLAFWATFAMLQTGAEVNTGEKKRYNKSESKHNRVKTKGL